MKQSDMKNRDYYEAPVAYAIGLLGECFLCQSVTGTEDVIVGSGFTDSDFE